MDKRRIEVSTGTAGVSNSFVDIAFDKGQAINIHGYRAELIVEPENADANSNGICAVYVLPGGVIQNSDLPSTFGEYGNEDLAPYLWGIHPWGASNQNPAHWVFAPKTSRNMQAGGRIVFAIRQDGISAGNARIISTQTCFTSSLK